MNPTPEYCMTAYVSTGVMGYSFRSRCNIYYSFAYAVPVQTLKDNSAVLGRATQ
jgi:hypothetical protein